MALPSPLQRILNWLHAGYPQGIPQQDYYPLLAFLARGLTADEVVRVVDALQDDNDDPRYQPTSDEVRAAIETVTTSPVLERDVKRIEETFRNLGWEPEPAVER